MAAPLMFSLGVLPVSARMARATIFQTRSQHAEVSGRAHLHELDGSAADGAPKGREGVAVARFHALDDEGGRDDLVQENVRLARSPFCLGRLGRQATLLAVLPHVADGTKGEHSAKTLSA